MFTRREWYAIIFLIGTCVLGMAIRFAFSENKAANIFIEKKDLPALSSDALSDSSGGLISINTAGISELVKIKGIGPKLAQNIIDYRNNKGRFRSLDELDSVKGIGKKKLALMKPSMRL